MAPHSAGKVTRGARNQSRLSCHVNRQFLPIKGFFFFYNCAQASLQPYLVVYLKQQGLSASESGVLFGSMPFLSFLVQPLVGAAADRWLKHKAVLVTATVLTGLFHLLLLAVPPRTPAGNVLMSNARLTCFSHHVPRLSVCGDGAGVPWVSSDCLDVENGSSTGSTKQDCVADEEELKTEGQVALCWRNVPDLLEAVSKGLTNATFYRCRVLCAESSPLANSDTGHNICLSLAQGISSNNTCIYTDLEFLPADQTPSPPHESLFAWNNASDQKQMLNNVRCSLYNLQPAVQNDTTQQLFCEDEDTSPCKIHCQRPSACDRELSSFDPMFGLLFVIYLAAYLTMAPVYPAINAITYALLKDRRHKYGQQRVWGTVGYLLVAVVTSVCMHFWIENASEINYDILFYASGLFCGVSAITACPVTIPEDIRCGNMLKNGWYLLTLPKVTMFLLVLFYFGFGFTGAGFVFWFLEDLGAPPEIFPLCLLCGVMSEVPVMTFCGRLVNRFGPVPCICVAIVTMSARLLAYSLLSNPWLVLLVEPLHGVTYGMMFPAATTYASVVSPPGMSATTQGLIGGVFNGLGRGAGGLVTGWMFSTVGARVTYRVWAGAGMALLVVYSLLHRLVFSEPTTSSSTDKTIVIEMKEANGADKSESHLPLVTASDTSTGEKDIRRTSSSDAKLLHSDGARQNTEQ